MKITDQLICRFDNEIRIFAKNHGLTAEIEHTLFNEKTDVRLSNGTQYKRYVLEWNDVPNFTTAINGVVRDASMFFASRRTKKTSQCYCDPFEIKNVIFSNPATIVLWADGTKTVVKCQEDDVYSEEVGLALCFAKKALGNKSNYNNVFKKWVPEVKSDYVYCGMVDTLPSDQMIAQATIEKLKSAVDNVPSPAEVISEFKKALYRKHGTEEV